MAYEKHAWTAGETITSELLNHIEDGIEDSAFVITYNDGTSNKTVSEIATALTDQAPLYLLDLSDETNSPAPVIRCVTSANPSTATLYVLNAISNEETELEFTFDIGGKIYVITETE